MKRASLCKGWRGNVFFMPLIKSVNCHSREGRNPEKKSKKEREKTCQQKQPQTKINELQTLL